MGPADYIPRGNKRKFIVSSDGKLSHKDLLKPKFNYLKPILNHIYESLLVVDIQYYIIIIDNYPIYININLLL